jgi:hypothetical protein
MWTNFLLCVAIAPQEPGAPIGAPQELISFDARVIALAAGDAGKTLFAITQDAGGTVSLRAYDCKRDACVWTAKISAANHYVALGSKLIFTCSGSGSGPMMMSLYDRATGQGRDSRGVLLSRYEGTTTGIVADARDRWAWLGNDKGLVARLVPGEPKQSTSRLLDNGGVRVLALDPEGKTLAVGGADGTLRFVDVSSTPRVDDKRVWKGHAAPVTTIAWSDNGSLVVSGDESGRVLIRATASGTERGAWQVHAGAIQCLALHPKGTWFASGDATGSVRCTDTKSGKELAQVALPKATGAAGEPKGAVRFAETKIGVAGLAFVEAGDRLVAAGYNLLCSIDVSAFGGK